MNVCAAIVPEGNAIGNVDLSFTVTLITASGELRIMLCGSYRQEMSTLPTLSSGSDFVISTGNLMIPNGEARVCRGLSAGDDQRVEDTESFSLTLMSTNGIASGNATVYITDNDGTLNSAIDSITRPFVECGGKLV